jgi:hypothetical protein
MEIALSRKKQGNGIGKMLIRTILRERVNDKQRPFLSISCSNAEVLVLIGHRGSLVMVLRLGLHSCMAMFGSLMAYGKRDGDTLCLCGGEAEARSMERLVCGRVNHI